MYRFYIWGIKMTQFLLRFILEIKRYHHFLFCKKFGFHYFLETSYMKTPEILDLIMNLKYFLIIPRRKSILDQNIIKKN